MLMQWYMNRARCLSLNKHQTIKEMSFMFLNYKNLKFELLINKTYEAFLYLTTP